jgi:hypothetical protein
MGTFVRALESKLQPLQRKELDNHCKDFLINCFRYLLTNLPHDNQLIRDAKYLQFQLKEKKSAVNAFSRMSIKVGKTLGKDGLMSYFGDHITTKYELCDKVKHELAIYQMESIPESFTHKREETQIQKPPQATSYWKEAYGLIGLETQQSTSPYRRCDEYWVDVSSVKSRFEFGISSLNS